jgi:hypothetical protein
VQQYSNTPAQHSSTALHVVNEREVDDSKKDCALVAVCRILLRLVKETETLNLTINLYIVEQQNTN